MHYPKSTHLSVRNYFIYASLVLTLVYWIMPIHSAQAASSNKCPGQSGYYYTNDKSKRNPRKGGFVSDSANVGDNVFIARTAAVCDSASVLKGARVYGNAVVKGEAEVTDKARVYGNATVAGEAVISGEAKVSGHAQIKGSATLTGKAWAKGYIVISKGTKSSGKLSSAKPKWIAKNERIRENRKNSAALKKEQVRELERFQRDLDQGWYGTDKRKGYYRNFKFSKSDVKPPCGFYLKLQKEEKVLDSHCRKTKKVRRKLWTPDGGNWKTVTNCTTDYEDQGEKYFNLKKLRVSSDRDFRNDRDYLKLNNYYFYVGNSRKIKEFKKRLVDYANKHCR